MGRRSDGHGKGKGAGTQEEGQEDVRGEREGEFGLGCFHSELLPRRPGKKCSSVIGSLGPKPQREDQNPCEWGVGHRSCEKLMRP